MKYNKRYFVLCTLVILFVISISYIKAQETIALSGGDVTGSGGTISYTVGQVAYTSNTGTTRSITQGVQQPFEIFVTTGNRRNPWD